jgi:hypothetical protein
MTSADASEAAPVESGLARALQWCVGALGWLIGFVGAGAVIMEAERSGGSGGAMWAFLIFGWAPVIFVHELGHALAALAVGWRVLVFHVAPCALRSQPLRVIFAGSLSGPDVAGSVFACPPSERERTGARDMTVSAGGPVISLALALVLVPGALLLWPTHEDLALIARLRDAFDHAYTASAAPADMTRAIVFALGLYSFAGFVLSAWPIFGPDGPKNDAALFFSTLAYGAGPAREAALGSAQMLWKLGIPTRHWPSWVQEGLEALRQDPDLRPATYALDVLIGLNEDATDALRAKLAEMRETHADMIDVIVVDAFVAACIDRDFPRAQQSLARNTDLNSADWWFTPYLWQLANAAIAANSGDAAMAEARLEAVKHASSAQPFTHDFWLAQIARVRGA